jgi:hypothetical protein
MVTDPPKYNDMDYFPIYGNFNGASQVNAVNFNYILGKGDIRVLEKDWVSRIINGPNQSIDVYAQDSFGCSLENIKNRVLEAMRGDGRVQKLLQDPHWSKTEREAYEHILAETTSEIVNDTVGFGEIKNDNEKQFKHPDHLNDISEDLDTLGDGIQKYETECETFSTIEGCVLQMVEHELLASYQHNDETAWKRPLNYFRTDGLMSFDRTDPFGGHAWLVTPTGNIIESTHDPDKPSTGPVYLKTNASLELWARGRPMYIKDRDDIYGPYWLDDDQKIDNTYRDTPPAHIFDDTPNIDNATFSKNGLFAVEQLNFLNGEPAVIAYQKMDIGSPDERYVPIDIQVGQALDDTYSLKYKDVLGDHTYRFTADENGAPKIERYNHNASYFNGAYWKWEDVTACIDMPQNSAQDMRTGFQENVHSTGLAAQTADTAPASFEHINTPKLS